MAIQTDLFDPNTKPSQANDILLWLKSGRDITAIQALNKFGCFRLASRISELKKSGYDIQSEMITSNGKRFARYWM